MSVQRYTSRTFQFRDAVMARLRDAAWPPSAFLPANVPSPHIGWHAEAAEFVMVDRVASGVDVARLGPTGRDERITATILIFTGIPRRTDDEAHARCAELADVVQRLFFDDTGPFPEPVALGLAGEFSSASIDRVELLPGRTPEGFEARCEIDVSVSADI